MLNVFAGIVVGLLGITLILFLLVLIKMAWEVLFSKF